MAQHQTGLKDCISFARFAYIYSTPPANRELAQVSATFQPDGAKVFVELIERSCANHFQVEPEILIISILNAQMPEGFLWSVISFGCSQCFLSLGTFIQVFGYATLGDDLTAVGADARVFGSTGHVKTPYPILAQF
jgi:hypothetical protein